MNADHAAALEWAKESNNWRGRSQYDINLAACYLELRELAKGAFAGDIKSIDALREVLGEDHD